MRPRNILDLFCGAGGAAAGLKEAGFQPVGVDLNPQPRYPGPVLVTDATKLPVDFLSRFDAIWASPPCQGYTAMRHAPGARGAPRLIRWALETLPKTGRPWILENVEGAKAEMPGALCLCGTMFGLGAQGCELQRHRLFMASFPIRAPGPCAHSGRPVIGVYGGHARRRAVSAGGRGTKDVWEGGHRAAAAEAMQMPWATLAEMSEAIPPAYSRHLGRQLLSHVARAGRTAG